MRRLLKSGGRTDSLDMFALKIQNRLYDLGIKWHNNTTSSEVQGRLSDSEVFLDFYQTEKINGKEAIYLFVVTKDRIDFIHYKNVLDTLSLQLHSSNYVNNSKKNKALYNYLLQPLEHYVVGKNRIYLSPDGILNQIALDILSPVGSKDQIFGDQFVLRYIENSKSLFENHLPTDAKDSYLITGGIQYDCTSPQDLLSATYKKSDFERSKTQYLEGSKREVDLIMSKLMDKNRGANIRRTTGMIAAGSGKAVYFQPGGRHSQHRLMNLKPASRIVGTAVKAVRAIWHA